MKLIGIFKTVGKTFKIAFPSPLLLFLSIAVTAILWLFLDVFGFENMPRPPDPLYFLLGTMSATLGTVLVLAFTFLLVAAQIASRYSQLLSDRVLGPWALWYAVPFFVGILLPLFLLHGEFYLWSAQLSLIVGVFCLISLFPFAAAVKRLLSVSDAIVERGEQLIASKTEQEAQAFTTELGHVSIGALSVKDFETFERGVQLLLECSKSGRARIDLRQTVAFEIRMMLLRNIDDLFASEILTRSITDLVLCVEKESKQFPSQEKVLDEVVEAYGAVNVAVVRSQIDRIETLAKYAESSIGECNSRITAKLQNLLHVIGLRALSGLPTESRCTLLVVSALGQMIQVEHISSISSMERDNLVTAAAMQIKTIGKAALMAGNSNVSDAAIVELERARRTFSSDTEGVLRQIEALMRELQ